MYYLITEYELPLLLSGQSRKLITIGNKKGFADMYDDHPFRNEIVMITEESLKEFMKDGFPTKNDAENANELKQEISDFIGIFFNGNFNVVSEDELLAKYKTLES